MRVFTIAAVIWTAIGLLVNAVIHFLLATPFDGNAGALISQGGLFRIQAVVNILAAGLIVVRPTRWTGLVASAVAIGGLGLLVFTVYAPLDLQAFGLPLIFEPVWYSDKVIAAVAQVIALAGGVMVAARLRHASAVVRHGS